MEKQNIETNNEELIRGVTYDTEQEKTYLILIDGIENDDAQQRYRDWDYVVGRQEAYDYIKNILESGYVIVDINESKIIVDSLKINDGISIYEFMKAMKEKDKIIDYSSFDIEDYI